MVYQIMVANLWILTYIACLARVRPSEESKIQFCLKISIELCVWIIFHHLYLFTDFVPDPEMRFKVGYSFIASIGFLGFLNIFALLYS
jgi:hypothetical protein